MTIKLLFKYIALAAIACCTVGLAHVTIQIAEQFIDLITSYADGISRLIP